jgi:hypothetical protein
MIREALEELEAISHPNEEQGQLREVLRTTALKAHDGITHSKLPAKTASHEQEAQSQRRSAFERLGPNGSQNREKKETTPKVIKSGIREKRGAEHLTTHPHNFFLG